MSDMNREEQYVTGRIVKVSEKGYGFIISPDIKFTRIFFHWSALLQDTLKFTELERGMRVRFVAKDVPGHGIRAIKISVVNGESHANNLPGMSDDELQP
jgi:cold shock CspA family protein